MFGFINLNKPRGSTSHDAVYVARRAFGIKQIGHAGTLDPLATGVLILCIGAATRLSDYVMHSTKRYQAVVHLGIATDSYDAEGAITAQTDATSITHEQVEAALTQFRGQLDQIPPMHSAIKQGGKPLYELARKGVTVERAARRVTIHALDVIDWQPPLITLDVTCGAGTYIRSLAHDLGAALGVGAHLAALTRTQSGRFDLANAITLDALRADPEPTRHLIPARVALADYPSITVSDDEALRLRQGKMIAHPSSIEGEVIMAFDARDQLVAILTPRAASLKPHKVFAVE